MEYRESAEIPDLPDEAEYPEELREHWELLECLSEKDDMRTLLASERGSGELCVVKCFLKGSALYGGSEPAALRELDAAPMPRFRGEYRNGQMRCVLREYVPGETLSQLAQRKHFSGEEVRSIGLDLCKQLEVLHGKDPPVIHRDIKPQNVVIRPDGTAVLIDFGIARVRTESETDTVVFGTQGFAPPEQYGFSQTDERSDIYSLGILLWWLLHGSTKIRTAGTDVLEKVISRCASFDPARRYSCARQVQRALRAAAPGKPGKRRFAVAAAAVLLLVLTAFGIFRAAGGRDRAAEFSQPLIEQAVRLNLGLEEGARISADMLAEVSALYIVADTAYPDADSFYAAIGRWYAEGRTVRGGITELSDLGRMPNLERIGIVAQELSDIAVLAQLPRLETAELKHNYITDIAPLEGMLRLRMVGLNDNPVRDISPLAGCPDLAFLDLCDVRSYDPSVLGNLGNFDFLDISNPTESYCFLKGKSVIDLRIAWSGMDDLHWLDGVTRLEHLEIDHSQVRNLSPLALHTGLKSLRLSGLPVTDLSVLLQLPQLQEITVSEDMRPLVDALGETPFTVTYE